MSEPTFALGELVKLLFALGVTIGLFYALALFMKRLQVGTGKSGTLITVLAALPLGTKEKLWVVDVAGEKLVIGTAPGSVSCLHVLNGDAEAALVSFPRKQESSAVEAGEVVETLRDELHSRQMDSRLRGNDAAPTADTARAFSEILGKFRNWQKP